MDKKTKASVAATLRAAATHLSASLDQGSAEGEEWSKAIVHMRQALGALKKAEKAGDMDYSVVKEKITEIMDLMDQYTMSIEDRWESDSN
jgi:hypothetical protein